MLHVLLAVLYAAARYTVVSSAECEPSLYLCPGSCPNFPKELQLKSETVCLRDTESDACVCWLNNPSSQLQSIFRCEAKINGSVSQVICNPSSDCFPPDPDRPVCLVVLECHCLHQDNEVFDHWRRAKAIVHTKEKASGHDYDGQSVEKIHGEIREFTLKHLLFLLGFVIAPLLCWCLLNFFHEGKCRKKSTEPAESQASPNARCSILDGQNANEDSRVESGCEEVVVVHSSSSPPRSASVLSQSVPLLQPSAPEPDESTLQTLLKCESPPPYSESMARSFNTDFGPPPAYEDAVRGTDIDLQQLWQTVFILQPGARDSS